MKTKLPTPAYYGDSSAEFWRVINGLPTPHKEAAYALGVALQNSERTLRDLIEITIRDAERSLKVKQGEKP